MDYLQIWINGNKDECKHSITQREMKTSSIKNSLKISFCLEMKLAIKCSRWKRNDPWASLQATRWLTLSLKNKYYDIKVTVLISKPSFLGQNEYWSKQYLIIPILVT